MLHLIIELVVGWTALKSCNFVELSGWECFFKIEEEDAFKYFHVTFMGDSDGDRLSVDSYEYIDF